MKNRYLLLLGFSFVAACLGCSVANSASNAAAGPSTQRSANGSAADVVPAATPDPSRLAQCVKVQMPGKVVFKSQSFAFDARPFEGSCFVTTANKDDMVDPTDLPRGSTFHIVKDGKVVYDLPDAFNEVPGCWVEAVGFSDVNGDGLTDAVIAGRCLAAHDSYGSNAIYLNTGKDFKARTAESDLKFQDLKTIKAIEAYVKAHPKTFF